MSEKKVYTKGVMAFAPNPKAPSFVKGSVVITLNHLFQWAKENPQYLTEYNGEKQVKFQITEWEGKFNMPVDTFVPSNGGSQQTKKEEEALDLPF